MHARQILGRAGEQAAARLLAGMGFSVVDTNWRCPGGEMDLVACKGSLVVFCEVKTRKTDSYGIPAEAVGWSKQQRLRRIARQWLADNRAGPVEVRFDVVSVIVRDGRAELTHIPGAF
jgi:putative endonuclease